ncbi:glycoside hydrolase family 79 protein [Mycena olivaceomarginata]|nr:glycoside hydrolase family 79 protein [Mycena olivaceomarginata]
MIPIVWFSLLPCALALTVTISSSPGTSAPYISKSLISLSIEQDRWPDWAGTSSKNEFFIQTLNNLKSITGAPPDIRIGANSEDKTNFAHDVQYAQDIFPAPTAIVPYPEALNITVGDSFYQIAQHLPEARTSGNEADLYLNNGFRKSYNSSQYVKEWTALASNISDAVGLSNTGTKFLVGSFAGSSSKTTGFSPQAIYSENVLASGPGSLIAALLGSFDHLSGSFCTGNGGLLSDLMTKATIRSNLTIYSNDVIATHAQGLDYILGETNSYACHPLAFGFKYSLVGIGTIPIQPVALDRSILDGSPVPLYYAAIIAAELRGSKEQVQISEIGINDTHVAGYAAFEGSRLVRAVFINSKAFLQGQENRTSVHLDLAFTGKSPEAMTIKRLAIGHADDASGLTWGGQTYETENGKVQGKPSLEVRNVTDGVDVSETEVVLLNFHL